jgi:ubiquinol-cytochrome c reductase cytochrome b subunit
MIFLFIALHIYLVFRNGISEPPKAGRPVDPKTYRAWYKQYLVDKSVPFWPNAAWRDVLFSSLIVILIILLAIFFGAPALTSPPDPSMVQTSPNPDWYMVPFFALFALMPHKIESIAMMIGPVLTVIILLSIPFLSNKGERSPLKRPWAMFGVLCVFVFVISLLVIGLQAPWSPDFKAVPLPLSAVRGASSKSGALQGLAAGQTAADSSLVRGVHFFYTKGCEYCHRINGYGGRAGPDLSIIGNLLSRQQLTLRIVNGGNNMPAFGGTLSKEELGDLVGFLSQQK